TIVREKNDLLEADRPSLRKSIQITISSCDINVVFVFPDDGQAATQMDSLEQGVPRLAIPFQHEEIPLEGCSEYALGIGVNRLRRDERPRKVQRSRQL